MGASAIQSYATAVPEALEAGEKTRKNADGCNASFIEDQGRVNYNSRDSRVEISDDGPIVVFDRADPDDPGTETFRIENGQVIKADGTSRALKPLETFPLSDGGKMTVETTFAEDGGNPVSKVTITNTARNGRNHAIDRRDWNNDFGLQVANVGGRGAMDVSTGSGKKLDKAAEDGEVNDSSLGSGFQPGFSPGLLPPGGGGAINKGGADVPPSGPGAPPDLDDQGPYRPGGDDSGGGSNVGHDESGRKSAWENIKDFFRPGRSKPSEPKFTPAQLEAQEVARAEFRARAEADEQRFQAGPDADYIARYGRSKYMPEPPFPKEGTQKIQNMLNHAAVRFGGNALTDEKFKAVYGHEKPPAGWGKTVLEKVHYLKTGEIRTPEQIWNAAGELSPERFKEMYGYDKSLIKPRTLLGDKTYPAPSLYPDQLNAEVAKLFNGTPLYAGNAPSRDDITQGQIGDCYLLAGLSSLAASQPGLIQNNINFQEGPPPVFQVTLYERAVGPEVGPNAPGVARTVAVSVSDVQTILHAKGPTASDKRSLWVTVYEAAYARMLPENHGVGPNGPLVLNDLSDGGFPEVALFALTGEDAAPYALAADLMPYFENALEAGKTVTISGGDDRGFFNKLFGISDGPDGILGTHAYSVAGIESRPGAEPVFVLRNPHGRAATPDGNVRVPVSQLMNSTAGIVVTVSAAPGENAIPKSPYPGVDIVRALYPEKVNVGPLMTRDEQLRLGWSDSRVLEEARIPLEGENDVLGGLLTLAGLGEVFSQRSGELDAVAAALLEKMRRYQGVPSLESSVGF
jgi:hypothetical protein